MDENRNSPTVEEIIVSFFEQQAARKTGLRAKRIHDVERDLRAYLEADGDRCVTAEGLQILNLERAFAPEGAFVRCMHAEDLFCALADFVKPAWLSEDRVQLGVQIRMVRELTQWMLRRKLISQAAAMSSLNPLLMELSHAERFRDSLIVLHRTL